jgi:hypothetical protein
MAEKWVRSPPLLGLSVFGLSDLSSIFDGVGGGWRYSDKRLTHAFSPHIQ